MSKVLDFILFADGTNTFFHITIPIFHPASRAFHLLAQFCRSRESMHVLNQVRFLWSMRCMLSGYSLEPKPNMPDLAAILVFHGTADSIIAIGFVTKRMLALEKTGLTRENKIDQSRSSGCEGFKELTRYRQSLLVSSSVQKKTKGGSARRVPIFSLNFAF